MIIEQAIYLYPFLVHASHPITIDTKIRTPNHNQNETQHPTSNTGWLETQKFSVDSNELMEPAIVPELLLIMLQVFSSSRHHVRLSLKSLHEAPFPPASAAASDLATSSNAAIASSSSSPSNSSCSTIATPSFRSGNSVTGPSSSGVFS